MIRNLVSAPTSGLASPPTINEQFTSGAGIFTLSGGASVSGGNLNLLTTNDKASSDHSTFGRGFYMQFSGKMRDFDFSEIWATAEIADGDGYQLYMYCDPLEDISVCGVFKNNGASGFGGPDFLINYVAGGYLTFFSGFNTVRMEVPASGNIILKLNGATRGSTSDATYSEFSAVDLEHSYSGGGYMTFFQMGAL